MAPGRKCGLFLGDLRPGNSADLCGTDGREHPSPQGSPSSRTPSYISGNFSTRTRRRRRRASGLSSSDLGSIRGQHEAHSISHQSGSLNNIPAAAAAVTGESHDARTSNSTRISPDLMLGSSLEDERGRDINRWRQLHGSLLRELNGQPSVASSVQSQPYTRWPSTVGSMHSPQRSSMYAPSPPTPSAVDLQPERNSLSDIFGQSRIREVSVAGYIPDVLGVRSSSNVATAAPAPASVVQNCSSNGAGDNIEEAAATSRNAAGKGASTDATGSGEMGAAAGAAAAAPPCPPSPPSPPAPVPPPSYSPEASRSSAPFHLGQHQSRHQSANAHPERSSSPAAPLNTTDAAPASAAAEIKGRHHKVRSAPHPSLDTGEPSPLRLHAFPPQQLAAHAATACAVAPGIAAAVSVL
ncbi:hypothetical protein DUNSADRAFT_16836 [Dunaliella salina]|uniref:Encoded protein n=1 Tax=Dunaliella salina TaxID=3046 RepID=A0ABQ7G2S4_DUNSA|nr:hypothetical protein DUNSADRAFT_16836 [Dunaliella salina]|eukprot:KAF5828906.1 hypothetical protein DUNSADRAFT_16836 [Dunaliella salina]